MGKKCLTMTLMKQEDVVELIQKRIAVAGSQQKLAEELGVTREYLSMVINGKLGVSARLAASLGLEKQTVFVPRTRGPIGK